MLDLEERDDLCWQSIHSRASKYPLSEGGASSPKLYYSESVHVAPVVEIEFPVAAWGHLCNPRSLIIKPH